MMIHIIYALFLILRDMYIKEDAVVGTRVEEQRDSHRMRSGTMEGGLRSQTVVFKCVLVKCNGSGTADWPG
jgi:hypothetical protein